MTTALNSLQPTDNEASSPLAARLDLLVRRTINVDQFEADMVRYCKASPDEVWNLLALLDQYHRLEKLPTELFRSLKASADRYGLVRREPYIPDLSPPEPPPVALPTEALAPPPTTPAPGATSAPFRHLLDAAAASDKRDAISVPQDQWKTGRFVQPEPLPPKRSWLRPLLLMIILAGAIAAAALLGRLGNPAAVVSNWRQMRDAVSGTPNPPASEPAAPQPATMAKPAAAREPAAAAGGAAGGGADNHTRRPRASSCGRGCDAHAHRTVCRSLCGGPRRLGGTRRCAPLRQPAGRSQLCLVD